MRSLVFRRSLPAAALVGCCLTLSVATAADTTTRRPNVVIFFADDLGTLDANCYGSHDLYTPNIDALAKSGVRFTQAYAHMVCCPARALLLTGRHPQRSGIDGWTQGDAKAAEGLNMALEEITLAEAFKSAGYRTGIFGKWHLGAKHGPTVQGFDEFYGHLGGFIDNYRHYLLHGSGFHDLYRGTEEVFERGTFFPDIVVREANRFLERHHDKPFFLYVPFNTPHYPEQADTKFDDRYSQLPMPRRSYAKAVSTTDDRLGRILDKLAELGVRGRTIVVFMSDNGHSQEDYFIKVDNHASGYPNGWHYGANGGGGNTGRWRGHKGTFFEGGIRVPAIINYPPAVPQGAVRDQAITAADWYPTLLELCGVELPKVKLDGASLLPIIRSSQAPSHHRVMHWQFFPHRWAVREGDWKLYVERSKVYLVNLSDAEPETINYAQQKPELVEHLRHLHELWLAEVTPQ